MTKQLIIGLATVAISGTALLASGMYAASTDTIAPTSNTTNMRHMNREKGVDMIASLSGKVSAGALQELQTLMTKHKAEMDTLIAQGSSVDKTVMETKHEAFKTEMDALMTKYPELKAAMPQKGFDHGKGGKNKEMETIIATLPSAVQTQLKDIHDSYRAKEEALRTEEKEKIDTLLSAYPDIKAKLELSRESGEKHMKKFEKGNN